MARLTMLLLSVAVAAGVANGCGGGGDDGLDKTEVVEQAQAACLAEKATLTDFNAWGEENRRPGVSAADMRGRVFEAVQLPAIEAELVALLELGVPENGAAGFEAFLAAEQRAIDAAAKVDGARSLAEMRRRFDVAAKLATDYGIPNCANPQNTLIGE